MDEQTPASDATDPRQRPTLKATLGGSLLNTPAPLNSPPVSPAAFSQSRTLGDWSVLYPERKRRWVLPPSSTGGIRKRPPGPVERPQASLKTLMAKFLDLHALPGALGQESHSLPRHLPGIFHCSCLRSRHPSLGKIPGSLRLPFPNHTSFPPPAWRPSPPSNPLPTVRPTPHCNPGGPVYRNGKLGPL